MSYAQKRYRNLLFGDGSDGDLTVLANTEAVGLKQFRNLTIAAGFNYYAKTSRYGLLHIQVAGTLRIATGAALHADDKGDSFTSSASKPTWFPSGITNGLSCPGSTSYSTGVSRYPYLIGVLPILGGGGGYGAGGSYSSKAGIVYYDFRDDQPATSQANYYSDFKADGEESGASIRNGNDPKAFWREGLIFMGCGGGSSEGDFIAYGGNGGSCLLIEARRVVIEGTGRISAKGGVGPDHNGIECGGGGGGGGGSVILTCERISDADAAKIICTGGAGGQGAGGEYTNGAVGDDGVVILRRAVA